MAAIIIMFAKTGYESEASPKQQQKPVGSFHSGFGWKMHSNATRNSPKCIVTLTRERVPKCVKKRYSVRFAFGLNACLWCPSTFTKVCSFLQLFLFLFLCFVYLNKWPKRNDDYATKKIKHRNSAGSKRMHVLGTVRTLSEAKTLSLFIFVLHPDFCFVIFLFCFFEVLLLHLSKAKEGVQGKCNATTERMMMMMMHREHWIENTGGSGHCSRAFSFNFPFRLLRVSELTEAKQKKRKKRSYKCF